MDNFRSACLTRFGLAGAFARATRRTLSRAVVSQNRLSARPAWCGKLGRKVVTASRWAKS